jgi:hypothetical protein
MAKPPKIGCRIVRLNFLTSDKLKLYHFKPKEKNYVFADLRKFQLRRKLGSQIPKPQIAEKIWATPNLPRLKRIRILKIV